MIFQRIICAVKGHRPFPSRPQPTIPLDNINPFKINNVSSTISSWNLPPNQSNGYLRIDTGPVIAEMCVCSRCNGVYWKNTYNKSWFASSKNIPELEDYINWQARQKWEEDQREKNLTAKKLYEQYRVALKLGFNGE